MDLFPPPQFLDVPFGALVFSDYHLKAMRLNSRTLHPEFSMEIPIPKGVMEFGVIKNEEEMSKILSEVSKSLGTPFVKFAVPDQISYVFTTSIPVAPETNLEESIASIIEENVPLSLSDTVFDFNIIKLVKEGGSNTALVAVTAISKSTIESYVTCINKAGMDVLLASGEAQAMAKSVIPRKSDGYFAVIYIHKDMVNIYVSQGQNIIFSSFAQLPDNSATSLFDSFVRAELIKSINYCKEKNILENDPSGAEPEVRCLVCGVYDLAVSVGNLLAKDGYRVSLSNVWTNTFSLEEYVPDISFDKSLLFAGAIGLFLE